MKLRSRRDPPKLRQAKPKSDYEVWFDGKVVYKGTSYTEACGVYDESVKRVKKAHGKAANKPVILYRGMTPLKSFSPWDSYKLRPLRDPRRTRKLRPSGKARGSRSRRDPGSRPHKTREARIKELEWRIKDITEALHNAVDLRNFAGIRKYTKQLEVAQRKLYDVTPPGVGPKRRRRDTLSLSVDQCNALVRQRRRGQVRGIP